MSPPLVQPPYQIGAGREHLKLVDEAVTVPSPASDAVDEARREAGIVVSIGVNEADASDSERQMCQRRGGSKVRR